MRLLDPAGPPGEAAFDRWTLVHVLAGLGLGALGSAWWLALVLLVGFEGVEAVLRRVGRGGRGLFEHESLANIVADIVAGAAGWLAGTLLLELLGLPRILAAMPK